MLKEISQFVRKSAAQIFTWPNRYRSEAFGASETLSGQFVTPETALTSSTVAACVRLLSETMASLPLHVYRDLGKSKVMAVDHPLYDMLRYAPNDFQTNWTFIQEAMSHCLLHGNFYAFIERDSSGDPVKLWPLNPRGVILEAVDGTIRYRYFYGGKKDLYGYRDILHLKGHSLDGLIGHSVIQMAREGIGLSLAQDRHAASLMRNNARLGTVITLPGKLREEQKQSIRENFARLFSGAMNAGKAVVLDEGMSVETVGMSSGDAQFLESRQFSVVEIARWFRVPPTMVGDMTRVSYSSSESELQLFAMHSLVPWCSNFEAEMNKKLFPERTQFFVKFDVNSIIRGDMSARYTAYSQGLNAGFLTVADVREAESLPFIEGTDQLNRPANLVPHSGGNDGNPEPIA